MPRGFRPTDVAVLDELTRRKRRIAEGGVLYRAGEPFNWLYLVRSGSLMALRQVGSTRRIMAFHLPGDMVGLEGIELRTYGHDVVAGEDSELCTIDYRELLRLCDHAPLVRQRFLQILSADIAGHQERFYLLGCLNAEQRVAGFLLHLAERHRAMGYARNRFTLRMRQADIGSYLDLTYETVSRVFAQLRRKRFLAVQRTGRKYPEIRLLDPPGLARLLEAGR
jgi:CRP/FNR family transcriptional regulator, anaerobic regulatory protein